MYYFTEKMRFVLFMRVSFVQCSFVVVSNFEEIMSENHNRIATDSINSSWCHTHLRSTTRILLSLLCLLVLLWQNQDTGRTGINFTLSLSLHSTEAMPINLSLCSKRSHGARSTCTCVISISACFHLSLNIIGYVVILATSLLCHLSFTHRLEASPSNYLSAHMGCVLWLCCS